MFAPLSVECIKGNCPYCKRASDPDAIVEVCPIVREVEHQKAKGGGERMAFEYAPVDEMTGDALGTAVKIAIESLLYADCPQDKKSGIMDYLIGEIPGISDEQYRLLAAQYHDNPTSDAILSSLEDLTVGV